MLKRWTLVVFTVLTCGPAAAQDANEAARHFDRGQVLYREGRYHPAIKAFERAYQASPHSSSLFNIARCHENLGSAIKALEYYRKALGAAQDARTKQDISKRIHRLANRPMKIFISSDPPGAGVTVDGRKAPEDRKTPLVTLLKPGEHVLTFRMKGHHLSSRRVVVKRGKEAPVAVKLEPLPDECPVSKPCPLCPACLEQKPLVEVDRVHVHFSVPIALGLSNDRDMAPGTGFQAYASYRRFTFGGTMLIFPKVKDTAQAKITTTTPTTPEEESVEYNLRWLVGMVEGGYIFAFKNFFIMTTVGLGLSADRASAAGKTADGTINTVQESIAFAWSVGGGFEAMVVKWLSIGIHSRVGMIHGNRADMDNLGVADEDDPFALFSLWGAVTLHL